MNYLLDTCACVEILHNNERVVQRYADANPRQCGISEITWAELLFGIEFNHKGLSAAKQEINRQQLKAFLASVTLLPITPVIPLFAREKARLWHMGQPIEDEDIYIGCTALVHGLTLVTDNVKHLSRLDGLSIENWME